MSSALQEVRLTHLMFADDLVIFCRAKPTSLKILIEVLKEFTSYSRLKANLAKSQLVFGGDCTQVQQDYLEITGFSEGHIPFRYLGMPITASKLSKLECRTIVE